MTTQQRWYVELWSITGDYARKHYTCSSRQQAVRIGNNIAYSLNNISQYKLHRLPNTTAKKASV